MQNDAYRHSPAITMGDTSQDPQWVLETSERTKPYVYYVFFYTYIPVIKFNLEIRHNKYNKAHLTTMTTNKMEQL